MGNLKKCSGCHRDLPRSMYPRRKDTCFNCTFNGPGAKEDIMPSARPVLPLNTELNEKEAVYIKHEEEILKVLKQHPNGLTRKDISKKVGLTSATLWPHLKRLETKGKCVIKHTIINSHVTNMYYPKDSLEEDTPLLKEQEDEVQQTTLNPQPSWGELKNKLILNGECGEALKIMVQMEKEASK